MPRDIGKIMPELARQNDEERTLQIVGMVCTEERIVRKQDTPGHADTSM